MEIVKRSSAMMDRVSVSTGVSDAPAIRLYESVGFTAVNKYLHYVKTE